MKFRIPLQDIIETRVSRRDYQNLEIEKSKIKSFEKLFKKPLVGPFGAKIQFKLFDLGKKDQTEKIKIGTYGFIGGARYFIGASVKKGPINIVDFGYVFEHVILKATDLGLGTCWLAATFRAEQVTKHFQLSDDEIIPAITPLGYPSDRYSIKETVFSRSIGARKRKSWNKLFFLEDFSQPLLEENSGEFAKPLEMVRIAPSGRNVQPWRIVKEQQKDIFHFFVETPGKTEGDNISKLKLLDIGIAICHFDLMTRDLKLKGKWFINNPNIGYKKNSQHYVTSWKRG